MVSSGAASSSHWGSLQLSVKQEWELAPPGLRLWLSADKGWSAHSVSGWSCCPKSRSLHISVLFTREWSSRLTDRLVTLYLSAVVKRAEWSFLVSLCSHKLWVVVERMPGCLGCPLEIWSSVIWEGLRVEPQLLHIERNQLSWFGHLANSWMRKARTLERLCLLFGNASAFCGAGRVGRGEHLSRDSCPSDPDPDKQEKMDGWSSD